jgi:hypothetical protein
MRLILFKYIFPDPQACRLRILFTTLNYLIYHACLNSWKKQVKTNLIKDCFENVNTRQYLIMQSQSMHI